MFFDRTKDVQLQGQEPEGSVTIVHKPRCSFYLLSVASEEDTPLVFVSYGDSPKWGIGKRQGSQAVFSTIPIELDGYLSLFSLPEGATRGFKHAVVPVYENFIREQNYGCEHATYVRESSSDFVVALANHGLSSQNLPRVAGGTWTHQDFLMWLESRRLKEQGRRSDLDSKVPARRARIASPSSSVLSSGLLLTAQECLRESDSPSNDFAGKLLLLHMLKKLNQSTGRTAYLPVLELSDQTSALGKYLAELEQKRRRERNCRDEIMELLETPLENLPAPSSSGFSNDLLSWSLAHEGITSSVEGTLAKLSGSPLTSGTNGMTNGEAGCHGDFSENDIHRLLVDLALGLNSRPIKRSCTADEGRDQLGPAREFLKELMERRNDAHLLSREEARERQEETTTLETLDYIIESTL